MIDTLLYILFAIAGLVLIVVILLQEGKGGGFGQALGEHGQQTFGVGARGIHKFTAYVAIAFLGSALVLHMRGRGAGSESVLTQIVPADPTAGAPIDPTGGAPIAPPPGAPVDQDG